MNEFTDKLIEEELALHQANSKDEMTAKKDGRYIFLYELFLATQDKTVIRSELLNILLAGRDTTAALLSNLLWELSRQPEMLSRLRLEIAQILCDDDDYGPRVLTYDELKSLKYLRALINESQRLHPIVPANSRSAHHDTILPRGGGPDGTQPLLVPKGSYVMYHTWGMHRRTDIFGEDADVFDPERWLKGNLRPGWGYIPFSGGPRVCIGQNFALTEVMFVVVQLVRRFDLVQKVFEAWRERLTIIAVGDGGCKVGLLDRRRGT
jgi:cytochrome P450